MQKRNMRRRQKLNMRQRQQLHFGQRQNLNRRQKLSLQTSCHGWFDGASATSGLQRLRSVRRLGSCGSRDTQRQWLPQLPKNVHGCPSSLKEWCLVAASVIGSPVVASGAGKCMAIDHQGVPIVMHTSQGNTLMGGLLLCLHPVVTP